MASGDQLRLSDFGDDLPFNAIRSTTKMTIDGRGPRPRIHAEPRQPTGLLKHQNTRRHTYLQNARSCILKTVDPSTRSNSALKDVAMAGRVEEMPAFEAASR